MRGSRWRPHPNPGLSQAAVRNTHGSKERELPSMAGWQWSSPEDRPTDHVRLRICNRERPPPSLERELYRMEGEENLTRTGKTQQLFPTQGQTHRRQEG